MIFPMFPCNPPQSSTKTATHIHTIHIVIKDQARFFFSFVNLILFEQIANKHQSICDFEEVGGGEGVVGDSQGYGQVELVLGVPVLIPLLLQVACRLLLCRSSPKDVKVVGAFLGLFQDQISI